MNIEDQLRADIARKADHFEVPLPDIDGFAAGAMRRRRRHRMLAALAACAVLGIVASGFVVGRSWWDTRGAGPVDQPTPPPPTQTRLSTDGRVGLIGPPPPGTAPSGPGTGELVAASVLYNTGSWVYADGRLINVWRAAQGSGHNHVTSDRYRGYVVRYLTPSGVEAMRSYLLDRTAKLTPLLVEQDGLMVREGGRLMTAKPFAACGESLPQDVGTLPGVQTRQCPPFEHPENWLPPSAWKDSTYRPFIPATFGVCLARAEDSAVLPARAADLFLASPSHDGLGEDCRAVATSDARTIADALEEAGAVREGSQELRFDLRSLGGQDLGFLPVLPHGGIYCADCG